MEALRVPFDHIRIDEQGRAWVAGTATRVLEIVLDQLAHGWSPEEIHFQHGAQLSMAQIHAALSFYYDHQAELDAEIQSEMDEVARLRAQVGDSPLRQRIRSAGHSA
jgi:uncharacterized protein (DUF433 family)